MVSVLNKMKTLYQIPYDYEEVFMSETTKFKHLGENLELQCYPHAMSELDKFIQARVDRTTSSNSFRVLSACFDGMVMYMFELLNEIYKNIETHEKLTSSNELITSCFSVLKYALYIKYKRAEELAATSKEYKTLLISMNKVLSGGSQCSLSNVYTEDKFLETIKVYCNEKQSRNEKPVTNICKLLSNLKVNKNNLDRASNRTESDYNNYLSSWNLFQREILTVASINYTKLFSSPLITCLKKFMHQQIQLKIQFLNDRQDYLDKLTEATPIVPEI